MAEQENFEDKLFSEPNADADAKEEVAECGHCEGSGIDGDSGGYCRCPIGQLKREQEKGMAGNILKEIKRKHKPRTQKAA